MKVCLVVNRHEVRDRLKTFLPKEWDIQVVRFGESMYGRRFDLILVPEWVRYPYSNVKEETIGRWISELKLRLALDGRIVDI